MESETFVGEGTEKELYDAALKGDVKKTLQLLEKHPYLVDGLSFPCSRNLLHLATLRGQADIVKEVLKINPNLARNLDSQKSSPLHIAAADRDLESVPGLWDCDDGQDIDPEVLRGLGDCDDGQVMNPVQVAAAKGRVEIAKKLLSVAPEMLWCRDGQGMNPVHVAAMNGHVEILKKMLQLDRGPAMERVHRGHTVLHLCVKHRQLWALVFLDKELGDLVAAKDDDGETLLHWAARMAAVVADDSITTYLVSRVKVEKQSMNSMGKTAKQIFEEGSTANFDSPRNITYLRRIKNILTVNNYEEPFFGLFSNPSMLELISKRREQTMVVMTLIATMAFQAAVSPPGGVWQEDTSSHRAGEAVIASTHPDLYKQFVRANTTAFVSSLITIFLVAVQQEVEKGFLLLFSTYAVWASLASIAISYGGSVLVTARPNTDTQSLSRVIKVVVAVSLSIFGATLLMHPIKWLWSRIKNTYLVWEVLQCLLYVKSKWTRLRGWVTGSSNEQNL